MGTQSESGGDEGAVAFQEAAVLARWPSRI